MELNVMYVGAKKLKELGNGAEYAVIIIYAKNVKKNMVESIIIRYLK